MNDAPAFVVLVAAGVAGLMFFFSRFSGWSLLAEHYPALGDFPPPKKRFGYGVFRGWLGYNGSIVVGSDARGLYLRGMPVVMFFTHRRIHIPWSGIRRIEKRSTWSGEVFAIHTRHAQEVDFALRPPTFAVVRDDARSAGVAGEY